MLVGGRADMVDAGREYAVGVGGAFVLGWVVVMFWWLFLGSVGEG